LQRTVETIKVPFVDLDNISKKSAKPICYFEMKGEIKFRKMEHFVNYAPGQCNYWFGGGTLLCQ
jgi:shikimate kinase